MRLPTCCFCRKTIPFGKIHKALLSFRQSVFCPSCGRKLYFSRRSRQKTGFINMAVVPSPLLLQAFGLPFQYTIALFLLLSFAGWLMYPFVCSFAEKEEPLW
ncbi:TIGR04104 family putative zinc finger protein [Aeribacillus pallidus]